jgi:hypothetical protein
MTLTTHHLVYAVFIAVGVVLLLIVSRVLLRRRPVKFNTSKFQERWQTAQAMCAQAETWPSAVIHADKLLDEALKKSHFKGKSMGERMVSAQRQLSDNSGVWFGHKLRNKIVHEDYGPLRQADVAKALRGFRQGLKDLGALK